MMPSPVIFTVSVGGYHPAKLRIYQDLIEAQLTKDVNVPVLNMLDTRYWIVPAQQNMPTPSVKVIMMRWVLAGL